jgi:hypothetical protein
VVVVVLWTVVVVEGTVVVEGAVVDVGTSLAGKSRYFTACAQV